MCIAEDKTNTVAGHTAYMKTSVHQGKGFLEYFFNIQFLRGCFVFLAEIGMHQFDHGSQIAEANIRMWFFTGEGKQFIGVDNIEITGQCEVTGWNRITVDKRMTIFEFIFSLGTITEMSQQQFSQEGHMAFHQAGMTLYIGMIFFEFINFFTNLLENIGNSLGRITTQPVHKGITRFHIELNRGNTGTILSAVMLLFHQQVQFI